MTRPPAPARAPSFPRRDANGRIGTWADMLAGVAFSIVVGIILVFAIDGLISLTGRGSFGSFSGWIAGVLAVWMFVEDFRSWRGVKVRLAVAFFAVVFALAVGIAVNVGLGSLPHVYSGAISVAIAALVYAAIWFFGVRSAANRLRER